MIPVVIKMNYDLLMQKEINSLTTVPTLLLHTCCAPCSSTCLKRLGDHFKITIFYYNPNITDKEEYQKRVEEVKKFLREFKVKYEIKLIEGSYEPNHFLEMAKGLEEEKERGKRCFQCYELRLMKTLEVAEKNHFDYFTTTLTLSPFKNVNWLNEIGEKIARNSSVKFLNSDFKKRNGYQESIEYSKKYHLYRQNYCGCIYSKKEMENKKKHDIIYL